MNYVKVYEALITSRVKLHSTRLIEKANKIYFENHHIIPKSKGGDNSNSNLVLLTAREHYLAHWLLWLIYRDRSSALAFHKMISNNKNQKRVISARDYAKAREAFRETNVGNTYGKGNKGRRVSDEQRQNHSLAMKGKFLGVNNPFYRKTHTSQTKLKLSEKRKSLKNESIHNYRGEKLIYKDGTFICKLASVKEVAVFINCSESNVKRVLSCSQPLANGYKIIHSN